jgi:alginate O-acetyltransferase complex protein AlgI
VGDERRRLVVTMVAVAANAGLLVALRYLDAFRTVATLSAGPAVGPAARAMAATRGWWGWFGDPNVLIVGGASLFTFHAVSYLVDVYRRDESATRRPLLASLFLLGLPQLVAAPVRYHVIVDQLSRRTIGIADFSYGVRRFLIGFGKKILIANSLAIPADRFFAVPAAQLTAGGAWLAVLCVTLHIYFDVSAYSDMAIGFARMLGFRLPENFRWPYVAGSVHELWNRWHMLLVGWYRRYLPGPLALRLPVAVLGCALWYGIGWNVLAWGLYHVVWLLLERLFVGRVLARMPMILRHLYLALVVMVGFVWLRTDSFASAIAMLSAMAGLNDVATLPRGLRLYVTPQMWTMIAAGLIGSAPPVRWLGRWSVAIDAATTSAVMVAFATVIFVWRRSTLAILSVVPGSRRAL